MELYTGLQYLQIDMANQFGLDQKSFPYRLTWAVENEDELEELVEYADDPFRYQAAVMAYRDAQKGIPTGHLTGLDATASGPQIMAAIMGCKTTAANTGLTGQTRMDLYTVTTKELQKLLEAKGIESIHYPRKEVKSAQMPFFYGSKQQPKKVFGWDTEELFAFYAAQNTVAPGAVKFMDIALGAWQPYDLEHSWTMPDGFEVIVPVLQMETKKIEVDELDHTVFSYRLKVNQGTESGLSLPANIVQSIDGFIDREMGRRCNYDRAYLEDVRDMLESPVIPNLGGVTRMEKIWRSSGFLSLRGIEGLHEEYAVACLSTDYAQALLELINDILKRPLFELVSVFDEFFSHANYMNEVRQTYIEIMAELAESEILSMILSQVTNEPVYIEKFSEDLGDLIRQAEYPLS